MSEIKERIHFIGIGGTGLSAIARVLHESGVSVSGSDRQESPLAGALREAGVTVHTGHDPDHVAGATLVVRSSAVPDDNVEVRRALAMGIPVLKRSDFLGRLMEGRTGIAVAGTHGKTTTTSMLAWLLSDQGLDPTFIVGGVVANLGTNAHAGAGPHFVIEADEYDRMFLGLRPSIAVVTSVEHDHPDLFPSAADFSAAFEAFVDLLPADGVLVVWGDRPETLHLRDRAAAAGVATRSYGFSGEVDCKAENLQPVAGSGYRFDVVHRGRSPGRVNLQVPGRHNVLNALAALAVGLELGLSFREASDSLARFAGVGRRFEVLGEPGGAAIVDDYAHHPTEIRATIAAARERYPGRPLWVVWQPHTYSRVTALRTAFAGSFRGADHVIVTPVYAARETKPDGFTLNGLLAELDHPDARQVGSLDGAVKLLNDLLSDGDVLLVLSAGDADQVSRRIHELRAGAGAAERI